MKGVTKQEVTQRERLFRKLPREGFYEGERRR